MPKVAIANHGEKKQVETHADRGVFGRRRRRIYVGRIIGHDPREFYDGKSVPSRNSGGPSVTIAACILAWKCLR